MRVETPQMTAEEFFEWAQRPENAGKRFELERRKLAEEARPGELHGTIRSNVDFVLGTFIRRRGKGHVCCADRGTMWDRPHESFRGPDVFFYDEKPCLIDLNPRCSDNVPTLVVEVLWPRDNMYRVMQLLRWGVQVVWVVHPEDRTVTVYRPDRGPAVLGRHDELTGGDVLPDFRCRVEDFFYTTGGDQACAEDTLTRAG